MNIHIKMFVTKEFSVVVSVLDKFLFMILAELFLKKNLGG